MGRQPCIDSGTHNLRFKLSSTEVVEVLEAAEGLGEGWRQHGRPTWVHMVLITHLEVLSDGWQIVTPLSCQELVLTCLGCKGPLLPVEGREVAFNGENFLSTLLSGGQPSKRESSSTSLNQWRHEPVSSKNLY